MNHSQSAYTTKTTTWTRADLLIALYDRTIITLRSLSEAIATDDVNVMKYRTSAVFLLEQIVDGVDPEICTFSDEIMRICEYAFRGVDQQDVESIDAAATALAKVQEGFSEIRDDAVVLENNGIIPPIHSPLEVEG